jgi:DNA helicase-2/ATP-dependent DNA helicase PcrA
MTANEPLSPEQAAIVNAELQLWSIARAKLPQEAVPYFAHMRVESAGHERDVLLGWTTRVGGEVALIDWRTAPLARAFFSVGEGDDYEIEAGGHEISGRLLQKFLIGFEHGEPARIASSSVAFVRDEAGEWRAAEPASPPLDTLAPGTTAARAVTGGVVVLDEAQRRAVELPAHRSLLALGEAGCGKTTVALYRMARLVLEAARQGRKLAAAVVVPTEGLRQLSARILEQLGAPDVACWTYEKWASHQARRAFPKLPLRESKSSLAGVVHIKRHPALREVLPAVARRAPEKNARVASQAKRIDLLHLFGDRALMDRVARAASGAVLQSMIEEVLSHTRVQFSRTTESERADVDEDKLRTVDGRSIDDGTPMEDAETIDPEDYAVLFELDRLRAQAQKTAPAEPEQYDVLLVDEAQELAPLELSLLGRAVSRTGTLLVAGDQGQQVDPSAAFTDWPTTMRELGATAFETATLEIGYRCPPAVTTLGRAVLSGGARLAGATMKPAADSAVQWARTDSELHLIAQLIEGLRRRMTDDPRASIGVIARTPEAAERLAGMLQWGIDAHLALDGRFRFAPGVQVTCVQEVKGLEFDDVVVPDASAAVYPGTPESSRALYVAMTRAVRQVVFGSAGRPSPLLAA